MRRTRRSKKNNRAGMLSITAVVFILMAVVYVKSEQIEVKTATYSQRIVQINKEKEEQEQRQEELVEYEKYVQTKKYVEEVAKDKLGLVYENEIIFKAKE